MYRQFGLYVGRILKGIKPAKLRTCRNDKLQAWLNFFLSEMHKGGFSPLFYKGVPEEEKTFFVRLVARFVYLDEHLRSNEYHGREYSVADAHFFIISNWASWVGFDLSTYANVVSYRRRIGARAPVRTALEAEGAIPWPSPVGAACVVNSPSCIGLEMMFIDREL